MKCPKAILVLVAAILAAANGPSHAATGTARTPHAEARLVAETLSVRPGQAFTAALVLRMKPGWHTYWSNPGDSGEPVRLTWEKTDAYEAGPLQFPAPRRIEMFPLANFGFEGEAVFLTQITPGLGLRDGDFLRLKAEAYWLVCKEDCIPERATLELKLPVRAAEAAPDPAGRELFQATRAALPRPWPGEKAALRESPGEWRLVLTTPRAAFPVPSQADFFPEEPGLIENAVRAHYSAKDGEWHLKLKRSSLGKALPNPLRGVLTATFAEPGALPAAYRVEASLEAPVSPLRASWLIAAFFGGMLLNLMPCVFPVLSIKVLSFVHRGGESRARARRHAWVHVFGVLVSFWILFGVLLLLRAGGAQLGWGFQLQSPVFLLVLIYLLFLMGLGLVSSSAWGASWMGLGQSLAGKSGYAGSFFGGVLATLVATPCMAPLVGSTVGIALSQPPAVSFGILTCLALGFAAPYLVLVFFPGALRWLPKPGAWMKTFEQAMAFLLFAAVLWLLWVFSLQTAVSSLLHALAGLWIVAFAFWFSQKWRVGKAAWLLLLSGLALGMAVRGLRPPAEDARPIAVAEAKWGDFSETALAELRAQHRPVFLNFTAAWCLTCQVNERLVLSRDEVRRAFAAKNVALLKADWTRQNPEISKALAGYGRQGVPVYVLYGGEPGAEPRLLPEILSVGLVLEALNEIPTPQAQGETP